MDNKEMQQGAADTQMDTEDVLKLVDEIESEAAAAEAEKAKAKAEAEKKAKSGFFGFGKKDKPAEKPQADAKEEKKTSDAGTKAGAGTKGSIKSGSNAKAGNRKSKGKAAAAKAPAKEETTSAEAAVQEQRELRRLSRTELLEMLVEMSEELDKTRAERDELAAKLADKELKISEAGNIAEAALTLSGIFEAAQDAADRYLMNVKKLRGY